MIPSAMDTASTSIVETSETDSNALRFVNKRIQDLRKKHNLILQKEISLGKKRRKVLRSKSRVIAQIDELEKLSKEISSLQSCKGSVNLNLADAAATEKSDETDSAASGAKRRRTVVEDNKLVDPETRDKQRYLCVSNGIVIFCLDLKQSKCQSFGNCHDLPPLPKIATLNWVENPISLGLFRFGSDAYVIGGKKPSVLTVDPNPLLDENHEGSSRVTHRLSLLGGNLSLSKCNIGKLTKPKVWPIIDKVDGQIHVFDTFPELYIDVPDWIFSHEVLTLADIWIEIPTFRDRDKEYSFFGEGDKDCIQSHSVVGDRIFAVANGGFLVFDSKTKKWVARLRRDRRDPFSVRRVWDILDLGIARCAGEFPHKEPIEPLYILIAALENARNNNNMLALAYLVTSTGQVLCYQCLPQIFDGPLQPYCMMKGTIINVDEEGKTMCAVISGKVCDDDDSCECLFIGIFTVKLLTDAAPEVRRHIWGNASKDGPAEQEFVRVDLKDRYIYKTDGDSDDIRRQLLAVQACFL